MSTGVREARRLRIKKGARERRKTTAALGSLWFRELWFRKRRRAGAIIIAPALSVTAGTRGADDQLGG